MKSKGKKSFINHSIVQMRCRLEGLVSGCDAANLRIEISAGAKSGCGFSLSRPMEGRQLPSERDAKGGIFCVYLLE